MSSEMREVLESLLTMRAHAVGTDERCAEFQAYKRAACDFFTVHGDQIERTLLARTEAGADGDKAGWQDGWPMAYHTRYRHVLEETIGQPFGEGTRLGSADIRRVAMAMAREFGVPTDTRPQDASGDAEVLTAHGIKALDRCCGELRKFIELAGDYDLDEMSVQALETAIESMEMRKANAMQAKEAK